MKEKDKEEARRIANEEMDKRKKKKSGNIKGDPTAECY